MPVNPHFAVVVGINTYPAIRRLQYATKDANDFYDWVTSSEGGAVAKSRAHRIVATLRDDATREEAQPTRDAVFQALERCIDECKRMVDARPDEWQKSRLYFFAAGHGFAPAPRDAALLAANASPRHLNEHVSCGTLLDYFSQVQHFREIVVFADCCRTEERLATPMPPPWTEDSINRGAIRKFFAAGAVFFNKAYERLDGEPDEQRGYFTRALVDGLNGGAIDPHAPSDPIKASQLKHFVTDHMRRNSALRFPVRPLLPDFIDEGPGELYFGAPNPRPPTPDNYPVTISISGAPVDELVITDGQRVSNRIDAIRDTNGNVFRCRLAVGLWEAIPVDGVPPQPTARNWIFKVTEGGGEYEFSNAD